jgi:hypothetical protein
MKKSIYLLKFLFIISLFVGCEDYQAVQFDNVNGQTAISLARTSYNLSIPEEDLTLEIPVNITTISPVERNFDVNIVSSTEGTSAEYSVGSVTIPANEYSGILTVDFFYAAISGEDGDVKDLVVEVASSDTVSAFDNTVNISYFREIVCNDLELTIISDVWATETGFRLEAADGTVIVDDFFPFSVNSTQPQEYNVSFTLDDGDYIFTLLDSFGDGQLGTGGGVTLTGSYALTCSIITHASGEGPLENGTFESTPFTVNP